MVRETLADPAARWIAEMSLKPQMIAVCLSLQVMPRELLWIRKVFTVSLIDIDPEGVYEAKQELTFAF